MGGSTLTAERQLRGSSFTNATACKGLAAEERGERKKHGRQRFHLSTQSDLK